MVTIPVWNERPILSTAPRIEWLVSLDRIERLEPQWRALERAVCGRTIASRYDYAIPWYHAYRGTAHEQYGDPLLGVAWSGGELIGLAPLTLWDGRLGKVPVRRIDSVGFNAQAGEFLIPDDRPDLPAIFLHSLRRSVNHDVVVLHGFDPQSRLMDHIEDLAGSGSIELEPYRYATVDLTQGFESHHRSMSRNFRRNVKRLAAKVTAAGTWSVDRIHGQKAASRLDECMERVFPIADRSWKTRVGGPMAEHHRAYLRETIRRFGRRGMIDFAFLNIAGRDAAFIIGIVERDVYYDLTISYDDKFADLSPGIHLMIELLRQLPDSGVRTVVSHGDHDYKNRWTRDWTTTSRLFVFNGRARGGLAHFSRFRIGPWLPGGQHH